MSSATGLFDNEAMRFVNIPELEHGKWFIDTKRNIYIVPTDQGEIEGPDDDTCEAIRKQIRRNGDISDVHCEKLGIAKVLDVLKRFDSRRGYFSA